MARLQALKEKVEVGSRAQHDQAAEITGPKEGFHSSAFIPESALPVFPAPVFWPVREKASR